MGKNGAGKTTLLTNIGSGNIEGMPPDLRTIYVQHEDASDDFGVPLIEEMLKRKDMTDAGVTRDEAISKLKSIKFTETMINSPRTSMSGGWKMKLLLVQAMLSKADILLLDEPTNHLDSASVRWLEEWLNNQPDITCMIVSHDTAFLDHVITDVIHYEQKKLVYYHGNLSHFVTIHPEAKYYYELESSSLSFKFPTPERLDGINSLTRAVIRLDGCTFTYPGAAKPQLRDITVKLCLGSRVAVIGANGAGKSTMIKLMVGETEPDKDADGNPIGEVWKHQNLRVAYVAQHSFHHVEEHLEKSPVDYMKWRFAGGVDKENLAKATMALTEEEIEEKKQKKMGDIDKIIGRRKVGKTMEYECTYVGQIDDNETQRDRYGRVIEKEGNKYIAVEKLIEMGFQKEILACDAKIAAVNAGQYLFNHS